MSNNANNSGFGQFVPGFEFLQSLATSMGGQSATGLPHLGQWTGPTFSVEDLEKRIEELKTVQFWLDQNCKALSATIQAMEVQKMTLATLRDLNVNFSEAASVSPEKEGATSMPPPGNGTAADNTTGHQIDPAQWWGALQQQFQNIAVNAMQDLSKQTPPSAAKKTGSEPASKAAPAKQKASARKKPTAKPVAKTMAKPAGTTTVRAARSSRST